MDREKLLREARLTKGEILVAVSEVTRMSPGTYCVAGLNIETEKMIRPLQADGSNWRLGSDRSVFGVGNIIRCSPTDVKNTAMPHATEDTRLTSQPKQIRELTEDDLHSILFPAAAVSIVKALGAKLTDNKYVEEGTRCRSLGGVVVTKNQIEFFEGWGKLRLELRDSDGNRYDLKVTSDLLQRIFTPAPTDPEPHFGVDEANEWLDAASAEDQIILRIGLTRPWDGKENNWNPRRCHVQLNGIVCPTDNWHIFAGPPGQPNRIR